MIGCRVILPRSAYDPLARSFRPTIRNGLSLSSCPFPPSQETMQQMAKKATAVYVESVEDLRGSPPHVD